MNEFIDQKGDGHSKQTPASSLEYMPSFQEHMQEMQEQAGAQPEQLEKSFFETNAEFDAQQLGEFRDKLLNSDKETTRQIIDSRIALLEETCDASDSISPNDQLIHRGYIGSKTSVGFEGGVVMVSMGSSYKLANTEYLHAAVNSIQENKESIKNGMDLFKQVEGFLNSYFGLPEMSNANRRMDVIEQKYDLNNPKWTDDEYFEILENIDISVFKGEHVALCSERTAMAQNILSLFGYETYYVNGVVDIDGRKEGHAFNVVVSKSGGKNIVDFSVTSTMEYMGMNWIMPTSGKIKDFDDFKQGDIVKVYTYAGHIADDGSVKRTPTHRVTYHARTKPARVGVYD